MRVIKANHQGNFYIYDKMIIPDLKILIKNKEKALKKYSGYFMESSDYFLIQKLYGNICFIFLKGVIRIEIPWREKEDTDEYFYSIYILLCYIKNMPLLYGIDIGIYSIRINGTHINSIDLTTNNKLWYLTRENSIEIYYTENDVNYKGDFHSHTNATIKDTNAISTIFRSYDYIITGSNDDFISDSDSD